jgi:hypothetical protein
MEAIMQWLMKCCARSALGLGAVALLLAGVPAHARPITGALGLAPAGETTCQERGLAPGDAFREGQPLRLAQSTAQQEEAEKQKQLRLKEQQEQEKLQQQQPKPQEMKKMRGPMPEAVPAKPGTSRFGAGVIRNKESADGD